MGSGNRIALMVLLAGMVLGGRADAGAGGTLYENRDGSGSVVRVYGTSTLHDWTAEGKTIRGTLRLAEGASLEPGGAEPAEVAAEMTLAIPAKLLHSVKDGKPYSKGMDKEMHEKLLAEFHPIITYRLTRLVFTGRREGPEAELLFDSEGEVTAAGVSKAITMPIEVTPLPEGRIRVRGEVRMKMTDFRIEPPRNLLILRTGDDVRVTFEWTAAAQ